MKTKKLLRTAQNRSFHVPAESNFIQHYTNNGSFPSLLVVLLGLLLSISCTKYGDSEPHSVQNKNMTANDEAEFATSRADLSWKTYWELRQARAATAKYLNINNAIRDQYKDINLVMPNMGYHFLQTGLIDSVFDIRKPELLVYNKKKDGSFELVAVEYAVPINPESPNIPPQGFSGDADVWDFNTNNTGLWTLHAWVWKENPAGIFNPTNPLVIVR